MGKCRVNESYSAEFELCQDIKRVGIYKFKFTLINKCVNNRNSNTTEPTLLVSKQVVPGTIGLTHLTHKSK